MASNKHQGWVASLNNGETVFEEDALSLNSDLSAIPATKSWDTLLSKVHREGCEITQLRLQRNGRTINSQSRASGYFQGYELRPTRSGRLQLYQGVGFIRDNLIFINWVNSSGVIMQECRELNEPYRSTISRSGVIEGG